jgi:cytochrome c biogenesis protein CcmG/thiol:disulfide interchange protein DsbE
MKTKLTILTLLFLLNFSFGQSKKYYMNNFGNIIDQQKYDQQKNILIEQIQKNSKSSQIVDELNELYNRNDSIVYSYTWHFTTNPKSKIKEIERKKAIIGKEYPIENETTLDGKKISLNDLKGKPTLINLWFTSCAPCIEEMPVLNELKSKYGEKFNFLSITFDSESKVKIFLEKHKFEFTHIVNSKKLTSKLGFNGYPINLFLDKNGAVKTIEGNVPIYQNANGELQKSDGMEFIKILEKLL